MGKKILKRAASLLAVLALAFSVIVGFQAPASAASCTEQRQQVGQCQGRIPRVAHVRAAQCLLRKAGYSVKVDGSFSASDASEGQEVPAQARPVRAPVG